MQASATSSDRINPDPLEPLVAGTLPLRSPEVALAGGDVRGAAADENFGPPISVH